MFAAELFNDDGFNALAARPQRLFIWLWLHPDLNGAGVIAIQAREWADAAGDLTEDNIREDAKTLLVEGWVDYDEGQLWLRPFMKFDGTLGSSTKYVSAARAVKTIRSRRLRHTVWEQFKMYPRPIAPVPMGDDRKRRWAESMNDSVDTAYAELERVISNPGVRESLAEIPHLIPHPIPHPMGCVDDEAVDDGEAEGSSPDFTGAEKQPSLCKHCTRHKPMRDGLCAACLGRGVKP